MTTSKPDKRSHPLPKLQYLTVTALRKESPAYVGVAASHRDDDGLEFVVVADTMVDLERAISRLENPDNERPHRIVNAWRCAFLQAENVVISPAPKWHDPEVTLRRLDVFDEGEIDEDDLI